MALLQCQSLPGIGCSGIAPARARVQQCLAAASHAPLPPPLLRANGGTSTTGRSPASVKAGDAIGFGRRGRRGLRVVAEAAAAAKVTPVSPGGVSISDVLWPSAGESQTLVRCCHGPWLLPPTRFPLLKMISKVFYFISTLRCDLLTGHGHVLALLARLCLKLRAAEELPEDDNYCLHIYFRKEIFLCISRQRKGVEVFMVL